MQNTKIDEVQIQEQDKDLSLISSEDGWVVLSEKLEFVAFFVCEDKANKYKEYSQVFPAIQSPHGIIFSKMENATHLEIRKKVDVALCELYK